MTMTRESASAECIAAVLDTVDGVFDRIVEWREALAPVLGSAVPVAEVDAAVEALVVPSLSEPNALMIGAGFVAAPGFLADAPWHLAWWLGHSNTFGIGSADPGLRRLVAEEDPSSESFRDYSTLEWWRVPAASGERHITGPYVDYLCTDDYTLTLTMPVMSGGAIVGVVGADLYVNDIERALLPRVRAIGGGATIVNASGRVVVSADPHRATGTLLRGASEAGIPCGGTSLVLVVE